MAKNKRGRVMGKWQKRGLYAACLIVGLAAGFAVGYFVQHEVKVHSRAAQTKKAVSTTKKQSASTTAKTTATAPEATASESQAGSSAVAQTTPTAATAAQAQQGPVASTPVKAMTAFLQSKGIDSTGMTYLVVATSKLDPTWKLDKGSQGSGQASYFLIHSVPDGYTVIDYGPTLTIEQIKADGAPSDLQPPG